MKAIKYLLPATLLALAACNDDDVKYVVEGEPINVIETSPETDVAPGTEYVTLTFSSPIEIANREMIEMDGTVIGTKLDGDRKDEEGNPIYRVTADGNRLMFAFHDDDALDYDETHTITLWRHAVKAEGESRFLGETYTFTFSTEGWVRPNQKANVATAPINPNATAEAKALYSMLLSNYGEKQLSGAMGEVAWGTGYTDLIASTTGNEVAVVGFDYIHLEASKAGANWINYADITPVKEAWEAGSIPAITWHWRVPESISESLSETLYDGDPVVMPGDWSGYLQLNDDAAKEVFGKLSVGAVIKVSTKDVAGAQGSFKDGASWGGLTDGNGTSYEYFDITGDFKMVVDADILAAIQANGLIISGHDYTLTGVSVEQQGAPSSNLTYNSTGFSVTKALTPGTTENAIIEQDMADIAAYLKLLQDAGIPVLWRPLHESAGDFVWGAWFWWGMEGPAKTIELWKYMYDKMTNEYGLNNLLWVWTLDYSEAGAPASVATMKTSYPGAEWVDIVGADIYNPDPFMNEDERFNRFMQVTDGKKMLALSEVGNLIDVDSAYHNGTLWSYCMQWYDMGDDGEFGFNLYNQATTWAEYMSNDKVLNRGDFSVK